MNYKVIILSPAQEMMDSLEKKLRAKSYRAIGLLEEYGPRLYEPHAKKITGVKDLFELRVKFGTNICRFFYFHHEDKIFVVTSGFVKKQQKTDKREIEKALDLMKLFKEG